jgi:hypothetical protein
LQRRVGGGGRVAILPFHNQTGRADLAWIDLGMMSTTIDALASASGVSVVSATDLLAVVGSQDSNTPLEAVAQKVASVLGVSLDVVQAVVKADPQGGMTLEYVGRGLAWVASTVLVRATTRSLFAGDGPGAAGSHRAPAATGAGRSRSAHPRKS